MKKCWWKVPLYCMIAGWICYQLEIRCVVKWAIITRPDGSVSADTTKCLIISACLFVLTVVIGGLLIFRKMSRKEVLLSALVMVGINIVIGLLGFRSSTISFYLMTLTEWQSIVGQLLYLITDNKWIDSIIFWIVPPFVFVPFGRKEQAES